MNEEDRERLGLSDDRWRQVKAFYYALVSHVDEQVGRGIELTRPASNRPAGGGIIGIGGGGITLQRSRVDERDDHDGDACARGEPRDHVTIARIVAGTAHDLPAPRIRKSAPRLADGSGAGTCHQCVPRYALVLDRRAIDFAHGGDGADIDR